jgi:hypothetical protein
MSRRGRFPIRTRDDDPLSVFVRGATVGAFVGAAIAGSAIWRRARRHPAGAWDVGPGLPRPAHAVRPGDDAGPNRS